MFTMFLPHSKPQCYYGFHFDSDNKWISDRGLRIIYDDDDTQVDTHSHRAGHDKLRDIPEKGDKETNGV